MSALPKLYINKICPFAHRAMIAAAHKNFACESIEISLTNMPDWYKNDVNPRGEVPALQLPNGVCLSESALIAQYIDDATEPKSSLFPPSGEARARIRLFEHQVEAIRWSMYDTLRAAPHDLERKLDGARAEIEKVLSLFSPTSDFAIGSSLTIADVHLIPFLVRFVATLKAFCKFDILREFPRLAAYYYQCLSVPSIASTTLSPEAYITAYISWANGKHLHWKYHVVRAEGCPFSERLVLTWAALVKGPCGMKYMRQVDGVVDGAVRSEGRFYSELVVDPNAVADEEKDAALAEAGGEDGGNVNVNYPALHRPCGGGVISDSIEAVTFLAERFTEAALVPSAAEDVFAGRWLVDTCGRVTDDIFGNILSKSKGFEVEAAVKGELLRADTLYGASPKGGPYLFGSHPTIYDFIVLPIFHRVDLLLGSDAFAALAPNIAAAVVAIRNDAVLSPCLVTADKFFSA